MLRIDKAIYDTNKVICDNISQLCFTDRGLLSQNILSQIRNFVEYIAKKIYSNGTDIDPNNYSLNAKALNYLNSRGELKFLRKFHEMLQKSVSHYTVDKDGSERLMLKYYEYLLKIKIYFKKTLNMDLLENIDNFPLNIDTEVYDYYKKIAEKIESPSDLSYSDIYNDRYYIQKVKPFFVNQKIYYEITFTAANVNASKFNRVIAFTQHGIIDNYAIKFSIHNDKIRILDKDMTILVIDRYEVSIRPCELENLSKILGIKDKYTTSSIEYRELMKYLSVYKTSLTELVNSEQYDYDNIKRNIKAKANIQSLKIFNMLDLCRNIIVNNKPGANILKYLLYKMNNRIIKWQFKNESCDNLSNLYLNYGCIPFDKMPYCTSLIQHNPKIYDLFESISDNGHEHELFARYLKNNTEIEGHLFIDKRKIENFEDVDGLIKRYNSLIYYKHTGRKIEEYKNHLYIKKYIDDTKNIIKKLQEFAASGVANYASSVDAWLARESYIIDDDSKKKILRCMFSNSHVAMIYGSAGTGKSMLIKHTANFFADQDKLFLANTHSAVDNMRRRIVVGNSEYSTIAKFLSKANNTTEYDILFIDECSTISNDDMRRVLEKANFKLLILVGDIYQIESIYFGNWFSIAQKFVSKNSIFELTHPYRTNNNNLLTVWKRVRNLEDSILEPLVNNGYVARLDESIFEHGDNDEIILCLNYDGLYGINNINRFLQNSNPNKSVVWGINTYKVNDPILFNESNIFSLLIHNNTKGKIVDIKIEEQKIWFNIELEEPINEIEAYGYDFQLIGESKAGKSIISFCVNKYRNTDEDDEDNDSSVVPFQVAYAVSIHKAQGLEYDSVKIIITNEVEERITHNIFYTAITRTKNRLKIYWSPETEQAVLKRFEIKNSIKDVSLLSKLASLKIVE